jgi:hypothetical protein
LAHLVKKVENPLLEPALGGEAERIGGEIEGYGLPP